MTSDVETSITVSKELYGFIGILIGAAIPLVKDYLQGRRAEKLERLKIHDLSRLQAYQRAYRFSSNLRLSLSDNSASKDLAFINENAKALYDLIEELPLFSSEVKNHIVELESVLELLMSQITHVDENSIITINKVIPIAQNLKNDILSDMKCWSL